MDDDSDTSEQEGNVHAQIYLFGLSTKPNN